jgi:hypothetical protein
MRCYLDSGLERHRRGRFLTSLVGAESTPNGLPESGVLMAIGKDFQVGPDDRRTALTDWTTRPGRTLLLLPPYAEGALWSALDWQLAFRETKPEPNGTRIPDLLVDEVSYRILGRDGDLDREAGHRWTDGTVNTRYLKTHSGSGVFAATCLPLWSIALLDEADPVKAWLDTLHAHTGPAQRIALPAGPARAGQTLGKDAFGVMVCLYGYGTADPDDVMQRVEAEAFPLIALGREQRDGIMSRLRGADYVDQTGLTDAGLQALRSSPYWGFAERLREVIR